MAKFEYICGDGFKERCSYVWDKGLIHQKHHNNWVFVKTDDVGEFFANVNLSNFTVISHNSDYSIDSGCIPFLNDNRVERWFAQNANVDHPKLVPIPIGIANSHWSHGNTSVLDRIRSENNPKNALFYANFSLNTNRIERQKCLDCTGIPLANDVDKGWNGFAGGYHQTNTFEGYLRATSRAMFCLSPRGNGIDCHRTWETLYVGSIPVVTRSKVVEEHGDLPIVMLDDWSDFRVSDFTADRFTKIIGGFDLSLLEMDRYIERLKANEI